MARAVQAPSSMEEQQEWPDDGDEENLHLEPLELLAVESDGHTDRGPGEITQADHEADKHCDQGSDHPHLQ